MSTSTSGSVTPDSPSYALHQAHPVLPLHSPIVDREQPPQLVTKARTSRAVTNELMPGIENVNRLWSLFEIMLDDLKAGGFDAQGTNPLADTDSAATLASHVSDDSSIDVSHERSNINAVVYQALHGNLRILKTLSYSERGLALIIALREGYTDVVHALLNKRSDLYAADAHGVTALRVAAETGQLKVLAYLLKVGCSVEPEPLAKDQRDAIQCAEQSGQMYAAVMMGLYTNIRRSMLEADHPYRHCRGESPVKPPRRHSTS